MISHDWSWFPLRGFHFQVYMLTFKEIQTPIILCRKMTRKKKNELSKSPQNSSEWQALLEREGLLLLDIYPGWAGPTASINFFINKFNVELQVQLFPNWVSPGEDGEGGEVPVCELLCSARAWDVQGPVPPCLRHDLSGQDNFYLQQKMNQTSKCLWTGKPVSVVHGSRTERLKVKVKI